MNNMQKPGVLDKILEEFIEECEQCDLDIDRNFARHFVNLLAQDCRDGLDFEEPITACKIRQFSRNLIQKYANPLDATVCNLKVCYFYKNCRELKVENVKEKYDSLFKAKLSRLIDDILQYPETCNKDQIAKMFEKMQVFIIACYNLGCPKNHVLLKQTRQSLNSVLGHGDLQNYVLKKKYHRLEYLQRLSATVSGILVFNNLSPNGDKENMRDIRVDLEMAQKNTKVALEDSLKKVDTCKGYGSSAIENIIQINVKQEKVICYWPIEKVREISKFVSLYNMCARFLRELLEAFEKTSYLISVALEKLKCVIAKINDVLKYRTAIESQLIFPHFVYLSDVWQSLVLYFNHLVEINTIRDKIESYVTEAIETRFVETVEQVKVKSQHTNKPTELTFAELIEKTNKKTQTSDLLQIKNYTADYCTLTIAITNGLLVPSILKKNLCENLSMNFGFSNFEFGKYAERHIAEYLKAFKNAAFNSIEMILLFDLEPQILSFEKGIEHKEKNSPNMDFQTQTEMEIIGDVSVPNRINTTWNKWDFHRETIRLANLRRRQTHSTQTVNSFGQRNAQNQAYNSRRHF